MPKAVALSDDILSAPVAQPKAAQPAPARLVKAEAKAKEPKEPTMPLQIQIPARDLKAIKIAAVEAGLNVSQFMLACFHARMKS